jgi:heme A synthase
MVVLGGVTRLTRSGLSMTDWKFAGGLPPLTVEQWQMEFLKYQNSPEYKRCVEDRKMMVKKKISPVAMCFFVAMTAAQTKIIFACLQWM